MGGALLAAVEASYHRPVVQVSLPLTYNEEDRTGAMTWTRQGPGPHITPDGFEGDGYQARYQSTTIPGWMAPASTEVVFHLSAKIYQNKMRGSREVVAYMGEDAATIRPKLELSLSADPSDSTMSILHARSYTGGGLQSTPIGRPGWAYQGRFPRLYSNGYQARPQGLLFLDSETLLVSGHYEDKESRVLKIRVSDGAILGEFTFGTTTFRHVAAFARRANGEIWTVDYETKKTLRLDLDASFASGVAVILATYDTSILTGLGCIEFLTYSGTEYALLGQYAISGSGVTPYVYAVEASKLTTGTFALADRFKRFAPGLRLQGFTFGQGKLYVSRNNVQGSEVLGGYVQRYDILGAMASMADGGTLTPEATYAGPSQFMEDVKFHPTTGELWTMTEGFTSVGSEEGSLAIWRSPLTAEVENHYTLHYTGAGECIVKVNNFHHTTKAWTPIIPVGAVTVGGPPQTAVGFQSGYFLGFVRNVMLQDMRLTKYEYLRTVAGGYDLRRLQAFPLTLVNPGAELGATTGWTSEVGAIGVRSALPPPYEGVNYFTGGAVVQSIARQRLDLLAQTGLTQAQIDAGGVWAKIRWRQASYDSISDVGSAGLRFLTAAGITLQENIGALIYTANSIPSGPWYWYARCLGISLVESTAKMDALMRFDRTAGTNSDAYMDALAITVYRRPAP